MSRHERRRESQKRAEWASQHNFIGRELFDCEVCQVGATLILIEEALEGGAIDLACAEAALDGKRIDLRFRHDRILEVPRAFVT